MDRGGPGPVCWVREALLLPGVTVRQEVRIHVMEVLDSLVASNWSQHPHKREEDGDLRQTDGRRT